MISFFYLNQDLTAMAPKNAALLLYFVEFILSEEGKALAANKYNMFNKLPDANERTALGEAVGLSARNVQVWFQNRRQREKPAAAGAPAASSASDGAAAGAPAASSAGDGAAASATVSGDASDGDVVSMDQAEVLEDILAHLYE